MSRPLAAILVLLALAPTAEALVVASPTRLQFEEAPLGSVLEGVIHVENKGTDATRVDVSAVVFEGELLAAEPDSFDLAPGETRAVVVTIRLGGNASGGRHDPRLEFIEIPLSSSGAAQGRAGLSVPLVFWVENLKIGNLEIPPGAPGTPAAARVLVQNFLGRPIAADVTVTVEDAAGREVQRATGRTQETPANASTSLTLDLPLPTIAGRYVVRAVASADGRTSNARTLPLLVGGPVLRFGVPQASEAPEGTRFSVDLRNEGDLAFEGVVVFVLDDGAGRRLRFASPDLKLPAGGTTTAIASGDPPEGAWRLTALATFEGVETSTDAAAVTVPGAPKAHPWWQIPAPSAIVSALVVAAVALALQRKREG